jgi:glycosyltransferase involved in cell wall biosynthesis
MQSPLHYSFKQRYYLNVLTRDGIRRADAIIVPSYATASALFEYLGADESKVHVIHHGAPSRVAKTSQSAISEFPNPYFLFVGRLETHKNVIGLVRAFTKFQQDHKGEGYKLLLAGKPGFGYERIKKAIEQSSFETDIVDLGYIAEERKWSLLRGATAFCFPSFSEGFGLPILEAQVAGVPVVTSNVTAMPEIASSTGALLVDPDDPEKIAEAMERVVSDRTLKNLLVTHGLENVSRFSWDKTARATLKVLLGDKA